MYLNMGLELIYSNLDRDVDRGVVSRLSLRFSVAPCQVPGQNVDTDHPLKECRICTNFYREVFDVNTHTVDLSFLLTVFSVPVCALSKLHSKIAGC